MKQPNYYFWVNLKMARMGKGLSQRALALKMRISPTTIKHYEDSVFEPREENLAKLCEILDKGEEFFRRKCSFFEVTTFHPKILAAEKLKVKAQVNECLNIISEIRPSLVREAMRENAAAPLPNKVIIEGLKALETLALAGQAFSYGNYFNKLPLILPNCTDEIAVAGRVGINTQILPFILTDNRPDIKWFREIAELKKEQDSRSIA